MSRLATSFLILLFLNTGAGNEPLASHLIIAPRQTSNFKLRTSNFGQAPVQGTTAAERGAWVARRVEDRETGKDARMSMRMRLFDRQQRVRERALTLLALKGGTGRPVPADRTLVRFTYPNDIKDTTFLVWEQPKGDAERFLYLPALGRVRRIVASQAQESFVGSDFTYEDIGGRQFDNYAYTLIDAPGAAWTAPDGAKHPVYTLESRTRDTSARFPRVVSLVRQDNFVVVHSEVHNQRNELQKTFDVIRLEKIGGYWTTLELRMVDALERTHTDLLVEKAEYDVGLSPDDFSRRVLERSGGR
jgi:hypothetical protein